MKRYNYITFVIGALPLMIACGASPSFDQNVILYGDNKVVTGNLELAVFNQIERDKNYQELIKDITLKEHEDVAYKADVSRAIASTLHTGSIKYSESKEEYVISLDYKKSPLNTYFNENLELKDSDTQKFAAHMFFMPKIDKNDLYHLDLQDNYLDVTYSYDYEGESARSYKFDHPIEELYYHANVMMFDLSNWKAKQDGDDASKMSNIKLTISGHVYLNSIK
ncbi:MAG: hypothetical protein MJ214_05710 [Bacilli bacterium]|nr:hypothetical protein [Bacilli bacterium]